MAPFDASSPTGKVARLRAADNVFLPAYQYVCGNPKSHAAVWRSGGSGIWFVRLGNAQESLQVLNNGAVAVT